MKSKIDTRYHTKVEGFIDSFGENECKSELWEIPTSTVGKFRNCFKSEVTKRTISECFSM